MNKQEALKKIEKLEGLTIKDKDFNFDIEMIPKGDVLEIIEQIDEPEKLYTVEIPNVNGSGYTKTFLGRNGNGNVELFRWSDYTSIEFADCWKKENFSQLTEAEIKEDFEWAWQFAEEVKE